MAAFAPKGVLAATDFSELSTLALQHAVLWAQCYRAPLTVLHVQEPPPVWSDPYLGAGNLTGLVEAAWTATAQHLERYVQEHVPDGVTVTRELLAGSPPAVIEEYVSGGRAELVVLGTHGRSGISRLLLGSVAERTLRLARHPTLLVRQPHAGEKRGDTPQAGTNSPHVRHVLCPVNDTEVARFAFEHACSVAKTFGARLTPVCVVEPEQEAQVPEDLWRLDGTLQSWVPAEARPAFEIRPVVRHGDAATTVIDLAREVGADLVVIGAQHRRFVDTTVLGVTTVRVTRHAPCPVLVVPAAEVRE